MSANKFKKLAGQAIELDAEKVKDNRTVWDAVAQTDPAFTKEVSYGRKFTAIDGYYNILRATELWGPFGQGWGYDLDDETITHTTGGTTAKVTLTLWYTSQNSAGEKVKYRCGPVIATNQLVDGKGRIDDEAYKKATTDALTKALSYLGFSADVFLGAFDDNRYVEGLKKEVEEKERTKSMPDKFIKLVNQIKTAKSLDELRNLYYGTYGNQEASPPTQPDPDLSLLTAAQRDYMLFQFNSAKSGLSA